jgi:lipoprotein-anchoring transpeptidase ErfK/SrfK
MLTRRHFIATSTALFGATPLLAQDAEVADTTAEAVTEEVVTEEVVARAPVSNSAMYNAWDARVTPAAYDPATSNPWGLHPRFLPTVVEARAGLTPGDIHVDAVARYLYHIRPDGLASRYGVAIAKGNLYEPGVYTIKVKKKWPTWKPTEDMVERDPGSYKQFENGVDGGPTNPLGSRALYLFEGNRDTYLRIHGTPWPRSIGQRSSSGCVRMVMAHIIGLYDQVAIGSTAHLYSPNGTLAARS